MSVDYAPVTREPGPLRVDLDGARVLVVDDNEDSLEMLGLIVEIFGAAALLAKSGAEGLELAREDPPDVILCDLRMPGMDGYEFLAQVRGDERLDGVRVVAVSGFDNERQIDRISQAGFSGHLGKPLDVDAVARLLADVLRSR